jgi:hypothetical protein
MNLLTHSRMQSWRRCPREHFFAYELSVRSVASAAALRRGNAVHLGLEVTSKDGLESALAAIRENYDHPPSWLQSVEDTNAWWYEYETCCVLTAYHAEYYKDQPLEVLSTERSFALSVINPATGAESKTWQAAGKIDRIVRLPDGRVAVQEYKTSSDDLSPESDYWKRLRIDSQISHYYIAAQRLEYPVETVLYDVLAWPRIEPTAVAIINDGAKVVLDPDGNRVRTKDGKKWRETADTAQGYTLQTRPMTLAEWRTKLEAHIAENPSRYFVRKEIPRLESDLLDYKFELWDMGKILRESQISGRWPRNTQSCAGFGRRCPYFDVCTTGADLTVDPLPDGFDRVTNINPELR